MATRTEVTQLVYELFEQRNICTLTEIREYVEEHGVVIQPNDAIVRVTLSNLCKKDSHVIRVERGVYQYVKNTPETGSGTVKKSSMTDAGTAAKDECAETDSAYAAEKNGITSEISKLTIEEVLEYLESTKKISWYKSPMEEIAEKREGMKHIQEIYDMIGKKLREVEGGI